MAGIVHFSNFFTWMEQAEHEVWRSLGTGVVITHNGQTLSWPRVSAECNYRRAARFEEIIDVEIGVSKIGTKSLTWQVRFFHEGTPVADGSVTTVCCVIEHGKPPVPVEIPAPIRNLLEEVLLPAN